MSASLNTDLVQLAGDAANRQSIRYQLIQFASLSWPGQRCIALWPDGVASVHIMDNGGRLRDLTHHTHPEMIDALQEKYCQLRIGTVIYLPPLRHPYGRASALLDLEDFFAGRTMLDLKECL